MIKMTEKEKEIYAELVRMGITIESTFIPWSKAKEMDYNKDAKFPSLNWNVTLYKNNKKILTAEFHEGQAFCPANEKAEGKRELNRMIARECEDGYETRYGVAMDFVSIDKKKPILPNIVTYVWCLLSDASFGTDDFENFCGDCGYDIDSRSAERIWKACVETASKIYSNFTTDELNLLDDLYQDY